MHRKHNLVGVKPIEVDKKRQRRYLTGFTTGIAAYGGYSAYTAYHGDYFLLATLCFTNFISAGAEAVSATLDYFLDP